MDESLKEKARYLGALPPEFIVDSRGIMVKMTALAGSSAAPVTAPDGSIAAPDAATIQDTMQDDALYGVGENKPQAESDLNRKDCGIICGLNCGLNEIAVYNYLKSNPESSLKETAQATNKSLRTVEASAALLKGKGLLYREGSKKAGKWVVKDNKN